MALWHAKFSAALDTLWNRSTTITSWRRHKRSFERPSSSSWHRQTTQRKRSRSGSLFSGAGTSHRRRRRLSRIPWPGALTPRYPIDSHPRGLGPSRMDRSLWRLWRESASSQANRVLLQFTSLAWSRRGFPFGVLFALRILRRRGARVAVVFHEPVRQTGDQALINRIRGACQDWVIQKLYASAERAIFADALCTIPWLPKEPARAVSSPLAQTFRSPSHFGCAPPADSTIKTITIFCLTDPQKELAGIFSLRAFRRISRYENPCSLPRQRNPGSNR